MACTASTSVARPHRELLEECMCAICRSILIHPVTLPCHHEMCMPCFKQTVEEASLCCPLCRTRISTWARRASKANALVDERRWKEIQSLFPVKVQRRLNGLDDESDDDDESEDISAHYRRMIHLSKPGEIRQEYEEELKRLTAQQEEERRKEEAASEALIQRLQSLEEEEAEEVRRQQEELEAQDEELARGLAEAVSAENSPSTTITPVKSSLSRKSSTDSSDLISASSGLQERGKKQPCTKEGSKTLETFFRRLPPGVKPVSRCSSLTHDFASTSHLDKWLKDSIPDRPVSAPVSSKASEEDLTKQCQRNGSACETWERDCSEGKSVKHSVVIHPPPSSLPTCSKYLSGKVNLQSVLEEKSPEDEVLTLSHFRPIQACPRTPPKSLPSGHPLEPTVVCFTPRVLITGTEQQAATSAFVKGPGCAERENREKGKSEGCEDSGRNMGSTMSRFLGHDDENEGEMNGIDEVSLDFGAKNKQVFKKVEEKRSKSSSPLRFNTTHEDSYASVERDTYSRPPINDYRERSHHSSVNRVDSPTFLLKLESHDCENVFGERNVQENGERSPEPKPSTSGASRPVGIFNPATVPPWTEGLYCEKGKGAARPKSPSCLNNGATEGQQSPVGKGKACGKKRAKNSRKKSGRDNSDDEEAVRRPAKVRKLSPLSADDESTVYSLVHAATGTVKGTGDCLLKGVKQTFRDKAGHQKAAKLKSKKAVNVKNAKGKPARMHSKKSHLVSKPTAVYADFIGSMNNLPAVNGEVVLDSDSTSPSKTSIISISSESSAASEVKVVENGSKKRSQERKGSTSGNNESISQPANSPAAEADTDAQAKGPQRTIKDWFSPKPTKHQGHSSNTHVHAATGTVNSGRIHKGVRANRLNSNASLKSDGSADKKGRHSKSASIPSTDVSHTVSNVLYASSSEASPDGKSARAKVASRSRKLKSECSCCSTDTCTLNKLDKYLNATSHQSPSKSKSKLSPSKNLTPSKKLTFPKSKDLTPSRKLSPFKNSIPSKHSTPSKKSALSKHSTPTKRQKLKQNNDSDHDVSPSRRALSRNGGVSDDKNFSSYSDDGTEDEEGLTPEEKDMRLALRLQAQFDMADRLQMDVIRFKGSDNEYSLRRGHSQSKLPKD